MVSFCTFFQNHNSPLLYFSTGFPTASHQEHLCVLNMLWNDVMKDMRGPLFSIRTPNLIRNCYLETISKTKREVFVDLSAYFSSKIVFHPHSSFLLYFTLSLSSLPSCSFFFSPLFGGLFPAVRMALPRHMFCGGPDYSPAVVLTLARTSSSSLHTHTHLLGP